MIRYVETGREVRTVLSLETMCTCDVFTLFSADCDEYDTYCVWEAPARLHLPYAAECETDGDQFCWSDAASAHTRSLHHVFLQFLRRVLSHARVVGDDGRTACGC